MRTNRQALKEAIESGAVQAWIDGKVVEFKLVEDRDEDYTAFEGHQSPPFARSEYTWRVPVIKKLRPWKAEEVPLGAICRERQCGKLRIIVSAGNTVIGMGCTFQRESSWYLENAEYSVDNGQTWMPCGVEE